jgi:hypothetical protein
MLTGLKANIRFDALTIITSLLLSGTYFLDRVIGNILLVYLRLHYDSHFMTKGSTQIDVKQMAFWTLFMQSYYLIVYHLLVLIAALLVFCHSKFKIYKRELFLAYIVIAVGDIAYFGLSRLFTKH